MTASSRKVSRRRAEVVAAAIAIGTHAVAFAAVVARPLPRNLAEEGPAVELSVTVDEPPTPTDESPSPAPSAEPLATRELPRAPVDPRRMPAAERSRSAESAPEVPTIETGPESSAEAPWAPSWTISRGIDLGLDGGIALQTAMQPDRSAGPSGGPTGDRDQGHLRAALDDRDRELGLGSGGPVVTAIHNVEDAVSAVRDGAATIEVTTDAEGHVVSVEAVGATSDEAKWDETARRIAAELKGRTLSVPRGARGVTVAVRVEVAVRTASGATAGKPISGMADQQGVGIGFDVSDIGSRARSVVRVHEIAERRR